MELGSLMEELGEGLRAMDGTDRNFIGRPMGLTNLDSGTLSDIEPATKEQTQLEPRLLAHM